MNGEKDSTHNGSDATFVQCTNADCSENSTVNGRTWWYTYLDTEAGLAANGKTEISRVYHIDRGYERIESKFKNVGADIKRISD